MNTGQIISLVGHIGLIGWLLFGGAWNSDPLPFEVSEVAVVSEAEYQAALRATRAPENISAVETPAPPAEPVEEENAAEPQADAPTETQDAPEVAQPEADPAPEVDSRTPVAETEVEDTAPQILQPEEDIAALTPGASVRPQLKPAERIAPEPVAQPEQPDAAPAEEERSEAIPDEEAEAPVEEEQSEATSPQEATTEINPEASDDVTLAPAQSTRPRPRPARPEQAADAPDTSNAVNDALAEALDGEEPAAEPAAPSGPPLTGGEREGLRVAVSSCWNLGALSTDAMAVTIVVGLDMTREAKPVIGSIKLISSEGGSSSAAQQAYEAARRAIIRCGSGGYDLPAEKYDRWKKIEMKFNPESMR